MARRTRREENEFDEWSVADLDLGYRVCAYNRGDHGGVHVHHPLDGPVVGRVAVDGPGEAEALIRRYRRAGHEVFDLEAFRQVVKRMEIRVEERMTGEALRDRILSRYGSREALEDQASHRASQDRGEEADQEGDRSGQSGQSGQSGRPGQSEVDATPETGRRSGPEPDSDPGTDSGPNRGLDPDRSSDPDPEPSPDSDTAQAQADLATLRTLEEDPDRLDARMRIARTTLLEPEDLADLTPARLQLLPALAENREAGRNITELADHLDRDKKNVSEDVEVLQHLGLADARRDGRSKIPFLPDAEIAIRIDPTEDAGGVDGLGGGPVARAG